MGLQASSSFLGGARSDRVERGFTLIELLTVIAIIAILASILLPVLSRSVNTGQRTACCSNLHQIAVAMRLYRQDYRAYPQDLTEAPLPSGAKWWEGAGLASLYPDYIPTTKLFSCPSSDVVDRDDSAYNSYDGPDPAKSAPDNLRYLRVWRTAGSGPDPSERRQLHWRSPPESTVITWCISHRRNPEGTAPRGSDRDPVVLLDGSVDMVLSSQSGHAWEE